MDVGVRNTMPIVDDKPLAGTNAETAEKSTVSANGDPQTGKDPLNKEMEQNGSVDNVPAAGAHEVPISTPSDIHSRPLTKAGSRNLQDSTFSISMENPQDSIHRASIRVQNPPGGKSCGGFW